MATDKKPDTKPHILMLLAAGETRESLIGMLRAEFEILIADDDETAWTLLGDIEDINLLMCGLDGPAAHGNELIARVRAAESMRVATVPILAITAADDSAARAAALAAGATDFVTMPVDPVQFVARAHAQVKLERTTRHLADATRALDQVSTEDPQTGTATARYLEQKGTQDLALALRHKEPMSVLRLDIDGFAAFRSEHGADVTTDLVVWVAKLLKKHCRREDTVSRLGGSEFAILAPKTDAGQSLQFCARLRAATAVQVFLVKGQPKSVTFSIGIAVAGVDPETEWSGLMQQAAKRLSDARTSGGDKAVATAMAPAPTPGAAKSPPAAPAASGITAEQALAMLAAHRESEIEPHLVALLLQLAPLFEFGNQKLNLSIGFAITSMKNRLEGLHGLEE